MFVLAFVAMGARLVVLQIVDAPGYVELAARQREREVTFPARRGAIFDRDGEPLAISVDMRTVFADPVLIDAPEGVAAKLSPLLRVDPEELVGKLKGSFPGDRFEYVARRVHPKLARRIAALDLPGIYMETEPKRYYPNAELASQLLGFVDVDGKGLTGVELQYDEILQGRAGRMALEQDPAGRPLPQAEFSYERPRPGRSMFLTIDKDIQYFTEQALSGAVDRYRADGGTAIVMRPRTGEVLALANDPGFDLNRFSSAPAEAQRNRALTDMYEPGSIFKIVTASAALEERVVTPRTPFDVPDSIQVSVETFNDSHAHAAARMTAAEIIRDSSNVGTIKIGLQLGGKKLERYIHKFGFGAPTGLDFPGEASGMVPARTDWSGVTIATLPIGQGIAVTPMQVAAAYATLANGGVSIEPKLVYGTMGAEGRLERSSDPAARGVVSRRTARQMNRILESVVSDGTGIMAQVPGYRVAGKTGTAQKPGPGGGYGSTYVASFGGFAPTHDPQLVVLVMLDEPTPIWGGMTSAPTFAEIMEFSLRHLGVSPTGNARQAARAIEEARATARVTGD